MGYGEKEKRKIWIIALRVVAMICVITPHLLAYRIDNLPSRYLAYYVLNRLHIIQFGGAFGVSIFFITSGYLTGLKAVEKEKSYVERFIKQVVFILIDVIVAMMFCMAFSKVFQYVFSAISGYESFYAKYVFEDWLSSALLIRNLLYKESTEGALWFLIPFLFFKIYVLIFDLCARNSDKKEELRIWTFFVLAFMGFVLLPYVDGLYLLTERIFYVAIIFFGYQFGLLHRGKITKNKFVVMVMVNFAVMLCSLEKTVMGIDDGYIVSAIYAAILFYVFYKIGDCFQNNKFFNYSDKIGMPFFLLHNCVGYNFIQLTFDVMSTGGGDLKKCVVC